MSNHKNNFSFKQRFTMKVFNISLSFFLILSIGSIALADHPNEGKVAITQLIDEAQQNSLEYKQAEENLKSLKARLYSAYGRLSPKLSLEGRQHSTQFDEVKSNGTAYFAKAEWNIYNGGSDKADINSTSSEIEFQESRLRYIKNRIKLEVSKIYYDLQFILESISLKKQALELNSHQLKIAKAKNNSGFTTTTDVLEFDLRDSTLQSDLVLLNQQLDKKYSDLNVLLSRKNLNPQEAVKGHLVRENVKIKRDEFLDKILKANELILLSKIELQKAETEKSQAKSLILPKLDLEAKYGKLSNDENIYQDKNNYSVMLKLSIPLFSGLQEYNLLKSESLKVSATQLSLEQKIISLSAELDTTIAEINALNLRLNLEEKNIERSEKYYKLTLDEYRRGTKNSPDMVGATERLIEARIRNLEYRRDLIFAKAKINELTGE